MATQAADTLKDDPEDEEAAAHEEGGSVNLEKLTKAQLVEYAAGQGVDLNTNMTKKDMIAKIEAE